MRNNSRLGCLTGTGIIAALIASLVIAGYVYAKGGVIYSPGPLNAQRGEMLGGVTSHAETGGECKVCHSAPWEAEKMEKRCMNCHSEVAAQIQNASSLHGGMLQNNAKLTCRNCHPEHRGADATLTAMEMSTFPHQVVGFSLNGHQIKATREPFTCDDCHPGDVSKFASDTCQTCHRQMDTAFALAHSLSYGDTCLNCHDGADRFSENFKHDFTFKLTGKHADVTCVKCHTDARTLADFPKTPQDCFSCHRTDDPHAGSFGTDCGGCHTANGWKPASFDHSKSTFPLTGAHVNVNCEKCHINNQFKGLSAACVSCHAEPAAHAGQFGTECAACHSTTAWSPAKFNGQHTFPLNHGESNGTSCTTCHPNGYTTYTCYGCHEHSEAGIRSKHLEEGITDYQDCMKCHPDGREREGD